MTANSPLQRIGQEKGIAMGSQELQRKLGFWAVLAPVFTVLKENENRSYDLLLGLYSRLEYVISEIKNSR